MQSPVLAAPPEASPGGDVDTGPGTADVAARSAAAPTSIEGLRGQVAALKIRGGNAKIERQVRIGGAALMAIGVAALVVTWFRASAPNTSVNNQMAYLLSGGLIGLSVVGIGAAVYLRAWLARLRYWQARQVVESREYTTQVLLLLARIEKLLGGTGEIPEGAADQVGSLWETIRSPEPDTATESARRAEALIGDPGMETAESLPASVSQDGGAALDLYPADLGGEVEGLSSGSGEPDYFGESAPVTNGNGSLRAIGDAGEAPNLYADTLGAAGSLVGASLSAEGVAGSAGEEAAPSREEAREELQPLYTNDHGHVWDHAAQQWYDPETHQWFNGIIGQWYRRDAPPPPY